MHAVPAAVAPEDGVVHLRASEVSGRCLYLLHSEIGNQQRGGSACRWFSVVIVMSFSSTFHWIRRGSDVEYIYQDHFQENLDVDLLTKIVLKSYLVA